MYTLMKQPCIIYTLYYVVRLFNLGIIAGIYCSLNNFGERV